jgi:hypothetical protein
MNEILRLLGWFSEYFLTKSLRMTQRQARKKSSGCTYGGNPDGYL